MALTELQLPTKTDFYRNLQNAATEMNSLINRWKDLSEFIGMVQTVDLDAMGVGTGQVRDDLVNFKTVLSELTEFFDGDSTTQTVVPANVVDKIRFM